MKSMFKKITGIAMASLMVGSMSMNAFAGYQMVGVDLWNATSDKASMGNVATDNNSEALYNTDTNKLQIALNPVNISGYISGVTKILYDTDGKGNFKEVNVLERGTVESGTRNDGNNYTVEYIQIMEIDVPSNLKKSGVELIDIQMSVPHTPMDNVIGDGYLDARLRIDWSTVKTTDVSKLVADNTMSGGEIENISLQDVKTGIRIIGDSSQVTSDALLYVEPITTGTMYEKAKATIGSDNFDLYDIRLGVNGVEVGMMSAGEIRIPYTGEVTVYRISEEGNKTVVRGTNGISEYSFLANQLGYVAVVGGNKQSIELVAGATDNGFLRNAGNSSTPATTTTTTTTSSNSFTDINSHWAKDNILYAVEKGLFNGVTETTFAPENNMTCAMVVTVLYRMAGTPDITTTDTAWYAKAVAWAKANDIVGSYGSFDPLRDVTREEFATMLYRFEKTKNTTVAGADLSKFTDNTQISSWAKEGLAWANAAGIVSGTTATTLAPVNSATRAVIATMLCNYLDM